jgi:hypothetical protein
VTHPRGGGSKFSVGRCALQFAITYAWPAQKCNKLSQKSGIRSNLLSGAKWGAAHPTEAETSVRAEAEASMKPEAESSI